MDRQKYSIFRSKIMNWLPALLAGVFLFIVPPVAIAIVIAYFTAPLVSAMRAVTKLPLTLCALIIMLFIISLFGASVFMALTGLMDILPIVELHIAPFTTNTDLVAQILTFLEGKVVEYGHALLEYGITFISTTFQQLFSVFIFLIAYFFALRESGKNRFWFLVYFPKKLRRSAKKIFSEASRLVGTFVSVETRLVFLTFLILSIGFFFLQFKAPVGTAFLISLADSLPFLGIGLFLLPMAAFFLYTDQIFIGISLILLYIFTIITRQITESYMWASTFHLKPIHAFFITACSVYLFGLPGILLTPFLLFAAFKVKQHPLFTIL